MDKIKSIITLNQFLEYATGISFENYKKEVVVFQFIEKNKDNFKKKIVAVPLIELRSIETGLVVHRMITVNDIKKGRVRAFRKQETIADLYDGMDIRNIKYVIRHSDIHIKSVDDLQKIVDQYFTNNGIEKYVPKQVEEVKKQQVSKNKNENKKLTVSVVGITETGETVPVQNNTDKNEDDFNFDDQDNGDVVLPV